MFVFAAFIGMGIGFSDSSSVSIASADEYSSSSYYSSVYSSSYGYSTSMSSSVSSSSQVSSSTSMSSITSSTTSSDSSTSSAACGNWVMEGDEECDDGPAGSEECSVICLAEYLCSCGCETSAGTEICAEERVPSNYCLNQSPKAKSKTECEGKTGSTCSGYEKGNATNKLTGTMKACTWKKKPSNVSSSSEPSSSSEVSSEFSSSSY